MTFTFHPEAEEELNLAVDYYSQCQANLGRDFGQRGLRGYTEYRRLSRSMDATLRKHKTMPCKQISLWCNLSN